MNISLFIGILIALQLICLFVGNRSSKNLTGEKDYFLAGKSVKFFPLMMTFVATQVGGGLILGSAEEAYRFGWSVMLYPIGACLGLIVLAAGIGRRLAQFEVSTVAQLFEVLYNSVSLKKIASLLSIISLFMVLIAQVIASKKFLVSLGMDQTTLFFLFWVSIILYTVVGGLKAVVSIDIVQASYFLAVFLAGFIYVIFFSDVSFSIQGLNLLTLQSEAFDFDASKLTGWLFMPLLFMVIEQDMAQRCFAAKSPKVVSKAALWSAIVTMIICIIPVFFGVLGKTLGLNIAEGSSVFMSVVQMMTNPTVAAFLGCAVMMAIISTAISLINAVSSNLTQDFDLPFLSKLNEVQKSRLITSVIGLAAVFGSFYFNNVVDLLIQSYELSVYCLFVPIFMALIKGRGNQLSAILSIIFGAAGFILFKIIHVDFPKEILSVMLSGVGYAVGECLVEFNRVRALE